MKPNRALTHMGLSVTVTIEYTLHKLRRLTRKLFYPLHLCLYIPSHCMCNQFFMLPINIIYVERNSAFKDEYCSGIKNLISKREINCIYFNFKASYLLRPVLS